MSCSMTYWFNVWWTRRDAEKTVRTNEREEEDGPWEVGLLAISIIKGPMPGNSHQRSALCNPSGLVL